MKTEVLIIGGGVAGLALANLVADAGLKTTVVEQRSYPIPQKTAYYGRTAALMGASVNILKTIGIWEEIKGKTAPLQTMRIIDDGNPSLEPVQIDFPANDINRTEFGHNVPNIMLNAVLADKALANPNITILSPAKIENYVTHASNVVATLDTGEEIEAKIIIGADGRFSKVREIAGIDAKESAYDQKAITCLIHHSQPHEFVSTEHHRNGGPFTTVPMPDMDDKHTSSVVWVENTADADQFIAMDKAELETALQKRTRGALGDVTLGSKPECWPLKGLIAAEITGARMALIAEAAHVMSPIGAQGLNLSLRDVATMAETLIDAARLGEDIGSAVTLGHYTKRRTVDMKTRYMGVDGYNRVVSNNIELIRQLRRTGLKSLKVIPALKHFAMSQGLSPKMDEGRLMRGEEL